MMTTPNIEELIDRLRDPQTRGTTGEWFDRAVAADLLQSQAERIAMLESLNELAVKQAETLVKQRDTLRAQLAEQATRKKYYEEMSYELQAERDAETKEVARLTAQLAAIAATEPVAKLKPCKEGWFIDLDNPPPITGETIELFTHPMPAQDVTELVDAFEHHIEQTRPIERSTIALSKYKGAK